MVDVVPTEVRYLDHMGSDLSVVNAARTSFGKETETFMPRDENLIRFLARGYMNEEWNNLKDFMATEAEFCSDEILDKFLRDVKSKATHFMPFCHAFLSFKIKCPIFTTRQLAKHQIGLAWSEESRRYLDDGIEFFMPNGWRSRPKGSIKQGSGDTFVTELMINQVPYPINEEVLFFVERGIKLYDQMIEAGVAPEQARMVLPLNMMTTFTWSGSLLAFARVANLRLDPHAQLETTEVVRKIHDIALPLFPVSWKALVNA
jgi:thymidylate synthase (FAD)